MLVGMLTPAIGEDVPRETIERIEHFVSLVVAENEHQNLIGRASMAEILSRHVEDSAQLLRFRERRGRWLDIGAGAGFPGIVLALLSADPMTLAEPRRLRAEFLARVKEELGLAHVTVVRSKAVLLTGRFDYITARAVASASALFAMTAHLVHRGTIFILPKGKSAQSELAEAQRTWQGEFRLEQSLTSDDAAIIVARHVRQRGKS